MVSPLTGIADRAGSAVTVTSYSGSDPTAAAATARSAQVALVFASGGEAEGTDLTNISLPNEQDAMIESVAAANPNTIYIFDGSDSEILLRTSAQTTPETIALVEGFWHNLGFAPKFEPEALVSGP